MIRHGERADKTVNNMEYEPLYDCPLTPEGHQQAFKSGQHLKDYFSGTDVEIEVISSPFLRCMETSMEICKALNVGKI